MKMKTMAFVWGICLALTWRTSLLSAQQMPTREALAQLRAKAEQGDAQAQSGLAEAYFIGGLGLAKDYVEAVKWCRKAAEQNHAHAQFNLGTCYANGHGVRKEEVEAVKWYRKAAEQNHAKAQYNLGVCYHEGQGVEKDEIEAVKWVRKAAEQNHAGAQSKLGLAYLLGQGVVRDAVQAVKWFRKAAEQNHARAQFNLGACYANGDGVRKEEVEAVKWYRKAAEQNYAEAQHNLGCCYHEGQGVKSDAVAAVKWVRKASEQNLAKAQYSLGVSCHEGDGVEKNEIEAYKWILLARAQGDDKARPNLTLLEGQLTPGQRAEGQRRAADFKAPEVSLLDALQTEDGVSLPADLLAQAEAGDAQAQNELGEGLYAGKQDMPKDPLQAAKWFRKAAEQNLAAAQSNLGVCYERGDGVAKYEVEAYKWDLLAAAQGDSKAKRNASMLELMMLPEQTAEGKQRAQDWLEERKATPRKTRVALRAFHVK
jgi:TPR repeat protein